MSKRVTRADLVGNLVSAADFAAELGFKSLRPLKARAKRHGVAIVRIGKEAVD